MGGTSPFLELPASAHVASNALAFAIREGFPVSPGHTLIVPRRLVATWFDATREEQKAIFDLVDEVKRRLDEERQPNGYNVGFNAGAAAGQTVMHLHVHVIPRFDGDMDDPRGGVRYVIPSKGNYLAGGGDAPRAGGDSAFVEKLMTLLDQGQFTATYKFAVLLGLVDLCMEHATEQGAAPSSVTTAQLAEKVLALYWPQATAYRATATVLRQSAGKQQDAKILSLIREFRSQHAPDASTTLARARAAAPGAFAALTRKVEWTLIDMPLPRAQMLSRRGDEDRFLYEISWTVREPVTEGEFGRGDFDNVIRFRAGAAEQLVALASVVRPVVQRRWAAKVAQLNTSIVEDAQLEEFLFGATRVSLAPVRAPLIELHDARCFYCGGKLGRDVDVDHFIAWARHPENAVQNLVPAHPACNESKSDHLAAAEHVTRWAERLRVRGSDLDDIARRATWEHDAGRALAVARVIYLRLRPDVRLWQARDAFERADRDALVGALAG